jgi:hypothetical protein
MRRSPATAKSLHPPARSDRRLFFWFDAGSLDRIMTTMTRIEISRQRPLALAVKTALLFLFLVVFADNALAAADVRVDLALNATNANGTDPLAVDPSP